jgi:signal transduction histidine kinase
LFVPLLFPDGRLPSPRWRPWAWAAAAVTAVWSAGFLFADGPLDEPPGLDNPFGIRGADRLQYLSLLEPAVIGLAVAAVVVRRRHAKGVEREQLRWLTFAGGVTAMCIVALIFAGPWGAVPAAITLVAVVALPLGVTVAIVRYRLYDIDLVINRTLVYGGLTGGVLVAYAVVVVVAGRMLGTEIEWRQSVLVTALITMAAYPLRQVLQRVVNRLMYGDRDDPYSAMSRLAQRLSDAVTPSGLLAAVAETIGQTLRLPYVAVELAGQPVPTVAAYGNPRGEPHRIDLVHMGEPVGTLLLEPRTPGGQFSAADLRVFDDVARQAAVAAHAVRLAEDLQRARQRLVLAREEERRRLRRDLHDGIGSTLAGIALFAGNARRALAPDGDGIDAATDWLARLEEHSWAAVADIRRVVNDLRPPTLDELGLVGALRAWAASTAVPVEVESRDLPTLAAGVEVAAYRIAVEAMTNTVKHAHASRCSVSLAAEEDVLVMEVTDDGHGFAPAHERGVGLSSMTERALELGGTCTVTSRSDGVTVEARLPLSGRMAEES